MPRTRSLAWAELKIGIVSVTAIILAGLMIFLLTGETGFFWQRYGLKTVFDDIAGLKEGAPVRVAGVEVGAVTGIAFVGDRVEVSMELQRSMQPRVTTTSVASLGSVSLLGEAAVDITASSGGTPIPAWGYVTSGRASGSLTDVASQATTGLEAATRLIEGLNKGQGTAGKLLTDETLYQELNQFVAAAEDVTRRIGDGRGTLGRLVNDPSAAKALEGSLQQLESLMAKLRAGEGTLGRLLSDDTLAKSLTSTTTNLDTLTARLNRGEGTAGKLLTDESLFARLNSMSERLDQVMTRLQQGQGTAGALLNDKQLYENMNSTVTEVRSLVNDIRKDPRRYLNIRVSLF